MSTHPEIDIYLFAGDADDRYCTALPERLHAQFTAPHARRPDIGAYQDGVSLIVLPGTFDEYFMAIGPKRRYKWRVPKREGYTFATFAPEQHLDAIYEINTSMTERQGRPMRARYLERPQYTALRPSSCARHRPIFYGVFGPNGKLVAYTMVNMAGEMCIFSTIMGHGEHLEKGVMFFMVIEVLRDLMSSAGVRFAMYNMHSSGTAGLRFFKEQLMFAPYWVNWHAGPRPGSAVDPVAHTPGARADTAQATTPRSAAS